MLDLRTQHVNESDPRFNNLIYHPDIAAGLALVEASERYDKVIAFAMKYALYDVADFAADQIDELKKDISPRIIEPFSVPTANFEEFLYACARLGYEGIDSRGAWYNLDRLSRLGLIPVEFGSRDEEGNFVPTEYTDGVEDIEGLGYSITRSDERIILNLTTVKAFLGDSFIEPKARNEFKDNDDTYGIVKAFAEAYIK